MKTTVALLLILLVAGVCLASPNRAVENIHLDLGDGTNCAWPVPDQTFVVRIYLDNLDAIGCETDGITGISFKFERTFGGLKIRQTSLLGGTDLGDVEADGWWCSTGGVCVEPDAAGVILVGEVEYQYSGVPGVIDVVPHSANGRVIADCGYGLCDWNLPDPPGGVGGVGMEPPRGCGAVPVASSTWGMVKALYR